MINLIKNHMTFMRYLFFSSFATLTDISILFILTDVFLLHYFASSTISYIIGGIIHYNLNKKYTFKNKSKRIAAQMCIFFSVAAFGLIINQAVMWILVEYLNLWYMLAKMIAIIIVLLWNFTGHKYFTFNIIK